MQRNSNLVAPGGVLFAVVRHDAGCPALDSERSADCLCAAVLELTTHAGFAAALAQTCEQVRAAQREAARAIDAARRAARRRQRAARRAQRGKR